MQMSVSKPKALEEQREAAAGTLIYDLCGSKSSEVNVVTPAA